LVLAEARIRGWITTSTAQAYYESGVKAALADAMLVNSSKVHTMAINQAYIDGYFTGEAAFKTSGTTADQLKQIWMQQYILHFMQNPEFSYFDYRRNTYPEFPINAATSLNANQTSKIPMRWTYPGSEITLNRENLDIAIRRQWADGYDEINQLMWLLK
jgi:hypothetical protein